MYPNTHTYVYIFKNTISHLHMYIHTDTCIYKSTTVLVEIQSVSPSLAFMVTPGTVTKVLGSTQPWSKTAKLYSSKSKDCPHQPSCQWIWKCGPSHESVLPKPKSLEGKGIFFVVVEELNWAKSKLPLKPGEFSECGAWTHQTFRTFRPPKISLEWTVYVLSTFCHK